MEQNDTVLEKVKFTATYAAQLMGSGVHTSRVIRNTKRIGESQGFEVKISVFQKSIILSLLCQDTNETFSEVIEIPPLPISFELNSELSALSWEAVDNGLSFASLKEKYENIMALPRIHPLFVLLLVGLANAAFCRLFGGDWMSMAIVFFATIAGFFVRQQMLKQHVNHYIIFIVSAFVVSLLSSTAFLFQGITSEIALTASVLYLVPGVPLINGIIDIVEGHTLTGISRLTNAILLIISLAIGLSFTLFLLKNRLV